MKVTVVLLLVCLLSTTLGVGEALGQGKDVKLTPTMDGFSGEYFSGSQKFLIEYRASNPKIFVSRIMNASSQTIVEAVQGPGVITMKVTDVTLTLTLNRTAPEKSQVSELSEEDRRKLEEFSRSNSAAIVREVLASIIRQKSRDGKDQLTGFLTIAMFLGEGPRASDVRQSNQSCGTPSFVRASYGPSAQMAQPSLFPKVSRSMDDCYGCCAPGCIGCFCYTEACGAHDGCVAVYGYFHAACNILFVFAVASMCAQCGVGCLPD